MAWSGEFITDFHGIIMWSIKCLFSKLLCLIGEAFGDESDQVCGAVINIRAKMDKISVWTREKNNDAANLKIGYEWFC